MAYTDFIAAIDLGTSHMVGMVGTKNATGALSIIAYEVGKKTGEGQDRAGICGTGWPVTPFYRAYGLQGVGNGRSGHRGDHRLSLSRV